MALRESLAARGLEDREERGRALVPRAAASSGDGLRVEVSACDVEECLAERSRIARGHQRAELANGPGAEQLGDPADRRAHHGTSTRERLADDVGRALGV